MEFCVSGSGILFGALAKAVVVAKVAVRTRFSPIMKFNLGVVQ